jgi:4-diphosphocytidyl-2-C-methyl-D-erythritol kinase
MTRSATLRSLAKINLALRVLHRRPDGYHELRTVFQTISLADRLEIEYQPARRTSITLEDPLAIPDNLAIRAARAVVSALGLNARIRMRLAKRIPLGAGLGGGSSDAAAVLLALPVLAGRSLPPESLARLAAGLGSDVPFFLTGGAALGLGRGEEIYPLPDLSPEPLLVVSPGFPIGTREAYQSLGRGLTFAGSSRYISNFRRFVGALGEGRSAAAASALSANDFESVVFRKHPLLKVLAGKLSKAGAAGVRMTGSGSAIWAVFRSRQERARANTSWEQDRALRPFQAMAAALVSRRAYRRLWRYQLREHLDQQSDLWPPRSRYER